MKSTHEPFDRDLKGRLLKYTEEPDRDLWPGIVPEIVSMDGAPEWTHWINRLSVLVIALSAVFFFIAEEQISPNERLGPASPSYTVIDTMQMSPLSDRDKGAISGNRGSISGNSIPGQITMPEGEGLTMEVHPTQFSSLVPDEQPLDDAHAIPVESDLSLSENRSGILSSSTELPESERFMGPSAKPAVVNSSTKITDMTSPREESAGTLEKQRRRKPFSLYFTAMPTFGYQRIQSNKTDAIKIHGIKRIPAFSADRLGVRLEAGAEIPLSKQWGVFGGLLYFQRKQTIDYIERELESINDGKGARSEYKYLSKSIEYELKNAGVQVGITYRLWMARKNATGQGSLIRGRKFSHVLGSGIEFHKALNKTQALERAENFTDPSSYVFFNVYYRMQYPTVGKLRAVLQPTLNYSFYINENLNAPFYVKPYGLGLNFGCTYNFR